MSYHIAIEKPQPKVNELSTPKENTMKKVTEKKAAAKVKDVKKFPASKAPGAAEKSPIKKAKAPVKKGK